jgi:DNA-directed RNA polymerase subunit K/omega|tara:strand:+ start:292 stop:573 length:282 start_codon:yes stop_codon:yes gene_type:complete
MDKNENNDTLMKNYDFKKLKTKNIKLTKYERTRVISERAAQIDSGSAILISNPERFNNSYQITIEELSQGKIPFIIKRPYNNTFEYIKLNDLL